MIDYKGFFTSVVNEDDELFWEIDAQDYFEVLDLENIWTGEGYDGEVYHMAAQVNHIFPTMAEGRKRIEEKRLDQD